MRIFFIGSKRFEVKGGDHMPDQETEIALLKQEVNFLKQEVSSIKTDVAQKFDRLEKKLDEALAGRPTWAVALVISGLLTVTTGLVVYVFAK